MVNSKLSLSALDALFQQYGGRELIVFEYPDLINIRLEQPGSAYLHETVKLTAGIITGEISTEEGFDGRVAFLEHWLVHPDSLNRVRVMLRMPRALFAALAAANVPHVVCSILHGRPQADGLASWARRLGFSHYATAYDRDWYYLSTKDYANERTEDPAAESTDAAAPGRPD